MQVSYRTAILKDSPRWAILLKSFLLVACLAFIFSRLWGQQSQIIALLHRIGSFNIFHLVGIVSVVLLFPVNWTIEAIKWRILSKPVQPLTLGQSITSVGTGLAFGFVTPRAIGDYIGRMIVFDSPKKVDILMPVMIARLSQLMPTLLFGLIGASYLSGGYLFNIKIWSLLLLAFLITGGIAGYFFIHRAHHHFQIINRLLGPLKYISYTHLLQITGLSFLRFSVFTLQFVVALWLFGVYADLNVLIAGVFWIFLAKTILPSFNFLSDLGVREFSALLFFESYGLPVVPVVSASLFIWGINILIPSIIGVYLGSKQKI